MALGIKRGEKVAIWATNVPYWVVLQFATAKIGAILLTVNTNYKKHELKYLLQQSECEEHFHHGRVPGHGLTCSPSRSLFTELKTRARGDINSEDFPHLKRVFFLGPEKHRGMYSVPEVLAMSAVVTDAQFQARKDELDPGDVVNMQYTSGTTGSPRASCSRTTTSATTASGSARTRLSKAVSACASQCPLFHCFGCVLGRAPLP